MAACSTRSELERVLGDPLRNQKAIRATLNDRSVEAWALPALADALRSADEARFGVLEVVARPCLSKKRVALVCGSVATEPWIRFFAKGGAATPKVSAAKRSAGTARRREVRAPTRAIPLRDAGALVRAGMNRGRQNRGRIRRAARASRSARKAWTRTSRVSCSAASACACTSGYGYRIRGVACARTAAANPSRRAYVPSPGDRRGWAADVDRRRRTIGPGEPVAFADQAVSRRSV